MKLLIILLFILLSQITSIAQSFMPGYQNTWTIRAIVIDQKGDSTRGVVTWMNHTRNIKELTIKDDQGIKQKFEEQDIKRVLAKLSDMDKLSMSMESSSSLKDLSQTDIKQVAEAKYFIWEPAITPKKGKLKVLQLVNPGFDSRIKVYRDPMAQETSGVGIAGVKLTGGIEKSYYLVKTGEDVATLMERGDYKKQFYDVFVKGCPTMEKFLEGKKPDWDDFAKHVFLNEQNCQ